MPQAAASKPKTTHKRLDGLTAKINQALERLLPKQGTAPKPLPEALRYCLFPGGKRYRPLLALAAAEAVGGSAAAALPVACAVELLHTYSLVHDDLPAMDNADQRRGVPSCHRAYGEAYAILIGDALLTLAFEVLSRMKHRQAGEIARVISVAGGTSGLIGGQVLDLQAISHSGSADEESINAIALRKTAALITASVEAGALAGGANAQALQRIRKFGQKLGLAFQMIDDCHDQDGMVAVLGKEGTRALAERLIAQALAVVEPFGRRAETLRILTRWLQATL